MRRGCKKKAMLTLPVLKEDEEGDQLLDSNYNDLKLERVKARFGHNSLGRGLHNLNK